MSELKEKIKLNILFCQKNPFKTPLKEGNHCRKLNPNCPFARQDLDFNLTHCEKSDFFNNPPSNRIKPAG